MSTFDGDSTSNSGLDDLAGPDIVERLESSAAAERIDLGSGSITFRSWGSGPPLFLLHGASGAWTHWVRNIEQLAMTRRVIVSDLPGFGDSDDLSDDSDVLVLVAHLTAAVEKITGTEQLDVVGFSFGGIIAGLMSRQLGSRVQRLVLISAGGIGMSGRIAQPSDASPRGQLVRFMFAEAASADDTALRIHLDNITKARFKSGAIPSSTLLLDALPRISSDIYAIYGDRDAYGDGDTNTFFDRLRRGRSDIECHTVLDAGHWIPYEQPTRLNALLSEILDRA
ncbi:MAG: 2-hydroxy-6-oxonona-2,4-dienedioate hydrolase [Candidatus Poriferisodalaceae bacterium]